MTIPRRSPTPRGRLHDKVVNLDRYRRRRVPPQAETREQRNLRRLAALADCTDPRQRLRLRNALVADNLPLVIHLAKRWRRNCQLPFDDLIQVGSIGLIRAVEAFDPGHRRRLSSFAVPYIQGAMQHEVRDRQHLVRVPRRHWELRQRLTCLQEQRRQRGEEPLPVWQLAEALGCGEELLRETLELPAVTALRSLDAPLAGGDGSASPLRLIDQLEAVPAGRGPRPPAGGDDRRSRWLRQQLRQLDPQQRHLLDGRLRLGCTWVELGRELGISPRQAQRRCTALLDRLQQAAVAWEEAGGRQGPAPVQAGRTPLRAIPIASRAAMNV